MAKVKVIADVVDRKALYAELMANSLLASVVSIDSESLISVPLDTGLISLIGIDPVEIISAFGEPICSRCKTYLTYLTLRQADLPSGDVIVAVVPWVLLDRAISICTLAEIHGASRIVCNNKLVRISEVDERLSPINFLSGDLKDDFSSGGIVVNSFVPENKEQDLGVEVSNLIKMFGFPLVFFGLTEGKVCEHYVCGGQWLCNGCKEFYVVDEWHKEYGLGRSSLPESSDWPVCTSPAITTVDLDSFSLERFFQLIKAEVPADDPLCVQIDLLWSFIAGSSLSKKLWNDSWQDLTFSERYILRIMAFFWCHLSNVRLVLNDVSLLDDVSCQCIWDMITSNADETLEVYWIEDNYNFYNLVSGLPDKIVIDSDSLPVSIEFSSVIDCQGLGVVMTDHLINTLDLQSSMASLFATLPESLILGLQESHFYCQQYGWQTKWGRAIKKQGYSLTDCLSMTIDRLLREVELSSVIVSCLMTLQEVGLGWLRLIDQVEKPVARFLKLIAWIDSREFSDLAGLKLNANYRDRDSLESDNVKSLLLLNPLIGCMPKDVEPFVNYLELMYQRNRRVYIATRQAWVRNYFGLYNN